MITFRWQQQMSVGQSLRALLSVAAAAAPAAALAANAPAAAAAATPETPLDAAPDGWAGLGFSGGSFGYCKLLREWLQVPVCTDTPWKL